MKIGIVQLVATASQATCGVGNCDFRSFSKKSIDFFLYKIPTLRTERLEISSSSLLNYPESIFKFKL